MRHLPRAPTLLRIEIRGGALCGITADGQDGVAIYRYAALQAALHSGQGVPYASRWPEHLKLFVYSYSPLPVLSPAQLPDGLQAEFAGRPRPAAGLRPWDQATFRGWPLYVHVLSGDDPPAARGVPHLFERVTLKLLPLPPPGTHDLGP